MADEKIGRSWEAGEQVAWTMGGWPPTEGTLEIGGMTYTICLATPADAAVGPAPAAHRPYSAEAGPLVVCRQTGRSFHLTWPQVIELAKHHAAIDQFLAPTPE